MSHLQVLGAVQLPCPKQILPEVGSGVQYGVQVPVNGIVG